MKLPMSNIKPKRKLLVALVAVIAFLGLSFAIAPAANAVQPCDKTVTWDTVDGAGGDTDVATPDVDTNGDGTQTATWPAVDPTLYEFCTASGVDAGPGGDNWSVDNDGTPATQSHTTADDTITVDSFSVTFRLINDPPPAHVVPPNPCTGDFIAYHGQPDGSLGDYVDGADGNISLNVSPLGPDGSAGWQLAGPNETITSAHVFTSDDASHDFGAGSGDYNLSSAVNITDVYVCGLHSNVVVAPPAKKPVVTPVVVPPVDTVENTVGSGAGSTGLPRGAGTDLGEFTPAQSHSSRLPLVAGGLIVLVATGFGLKRRARG